VKRNGFSLLELMMAICIAGILAAIAIPSYGHYIHATNRTDATRTMIADAQALERCYSQSFTYAGCTAAAAGTANSAQGFYSVTIIIGSPAVSYTITAVPIAPPQLTDDSCATFTLNSAGTQGATSSNNSDATPVCWGST
jgi:type IV pilus assembly protein PilE